MEISRVQPSDNELMGGSIGVGRAGAAGAAPKPEAPPQAEPAGPGAVLTVLYAEDNELNIELMRQLLTLCPGCELIVARSGREAIDLAQATPPRLLLIDMNLGDMDGLQVLEALRDVAALKNVPRIVLSADALPQSIRAARDAGFDEYLTKPVDVKRLLAVLDGYRAGARG